MPTPEARREALQRAEQALADWRARVGELGSAGIAAYLRLDEEVRRARRRVEHDPALEPADR